MCVVSMITQHYLDEWGKYRRYPYVPPQNPYGTPYLAPQPIPQEDLEKQLDQFKKLFEKAQEYDVKNNQPHCELDEKKKALKAIAEHLGLDIAFIDKDNNAKKG